MQASVVLERNEHLQVHGVVEISAPETEAEQDIEIVLCVDLSGSMFGLALDTVKAMLKYVFERVDLSAKLSLVVFSDKARVLLELGHHAMDIVLPLLYGLQALGGTNIEDALRVSLGQFTGTADAEVLLLLTDGCANVGERCASCIMKTVDLSPLCTVHTVGFGAHLDTQLLTTLAENSRGMFVHVPDAAAMVSKAGMLLEQSLSVAATNVVLHMPQNLVENLSGVPEYVGSMLKGERLFFPFRVRREAPFHFSFVLHWSNGARVPQPDELIDLEMEPTLPVLVPRVRGHLLRVEIAEYLQQNPSDAARLPVLLQMLENCVFENESMRALLKCRLLAPASGAANELLRQRSLDVNLMDNPFVMPLMREASKSANEYVNARMYR